MTSVTLRVTTASTRAATDATVATDHFVSKPAATQAYASGERTNTAMVGASTARNVSRVTRDVSVFPAACWPAGSLPHITVASTHWSDTCTVLRLPSFSWPSPALP